MTGRQRWMRPGAVMKTIAAALAMLALAPVGAACVGDSPQAVAKWVWTHQPRLAAADGERYISAGFLKAIRRDAANAKASGDICEMCGGDLWTDSQEGSARAPQSFKLATVAGDRAEVVFTTRFLNGKRALETRGARIKLRREAGCWKLDDIVHEGTGLLPAR